VTVTSRWERINVAAKGAGTSSSCRLSSWSAILMAIPEVMPALLVDPTGHHRPWPRRHRCPAPGRLPAAGAQRSRWQPTHRGGGGESSCIAAVRVFGGADDGASVAAIGCELDGVEDARQVGRGRPSSGLRDRPDRRPGPDEPRLL